MVPQLISPFCSHDYASEISAKNGGTTILSFYEYNQSAYFQFQNAMLEYAQYVRQQNQQNTALSDETRKQKKQTIMLLEGPGSLSLIPPEYLGAKGQETAEHSSQIIRHYITKHYCMSYVYFLNVFLHFQ
jgi:hypothetical protein